MPKMIPSTLSDEEWWSVNDSTIPYPFNNSSLQILDQSSTKGTSAKSNHQVQLSDSIDEHPSGFVMLDDHVLPSSHVQTQQEPPHATFTSLENLPAPIRPRQSQIQLHNDPRLGFDVFEDHAFPTIQVQTQQIPLSKSPHALFGVFQNQTFHLCQSRTRQTELPNEPRTGFVPLDSRAFSSIQSQQTLLSNSVNESHSKYGASTDIHHKNFYQSIPLSQSKNHQYSMINDVVQILEKLGFKDDVQQLKNGRIDFQDILNRTKEDWNRIARATAVHNELQNLVQSYHHQNIQQNLQENLQKNHHNTSKKDIKFTQYIPDIISNSDRSEIEKIIKASPPYHAFQDGLASYFSVVGTHTLTVECQSCHYYIPYTIFYINGFDKKSAHRQGWKKGPYSIQNNPFVSSTSHANECAIKNVKSLKVPYIICNYCKNQKLPKNRDLSENPQKMHNHILECQGG